MPNGLKSQYFAAQDSKTTVSEVESRAEAWGRSTVSNTYLDKTRRSWQYYHGAYYEQGTDHRVSFTGDQGEIVQFPVNHYRNIGLHLLNMTTANRPALQARATNTDYKSLSQTILANGLLEYYMREKGLEDYLKRAAEYAIVFGEGYVKMEWDATSGEIYDYEINEDTGTKIPIYEGDLRYTNMSVYDVIRDSTKETSQHDWLCCRSYKNRFALAAKYPELADEILKIKSKDDLDKIRFPIYGPAKTDDIAVYEFYHVRNDALPDGRYILYASPEAIMYDGPLPYPEIPVYRISASEFLGTPYGYTILFDLLPIQEAINLLYGIIITNQNAFGVQNILVPKGADLNLSQLVGSLNILEYDPIKGEPKPLNLTQTPGEVFKMLDKLENTMETISGINSVTRGNPEASLKSGAALALVQAQAVQFASNLQQSYVRLVEGVGTATIKILQWYAKVPRVAAIVGKSNRAYTKEFSGEDLSKISRVAVELANPLSKTTAGRLEIANQLLQMQLIKTPEQYFTVLNTGQLDTMIEGSQAELLLIRSENENMMDGVKPVAVAFDIHKTHIEEHKALLADPDLRTDPELVNTVLSHIQDHINLLRTADPGILMVTGQQPLPPPPPPPGSQPPPGPPQGPAPGPQMGPPQGPPMPPHHAGPGAPHKIANPTSAAHTQKTMGELSAPLPVGPNGEQNHIPKVPHPPAPFQGLPTNPANLLPK